VIAGVFAGADYGRYYWTTGRFLVTTDDAYVDVHSAMISPKVSGYISDVPVNDNQAVKAGQVIARIDPRDYETALDQARANADATGRAATPHGRTGPSAGGVGSSSARLFAAGLPAIHGSGSHRLRHGAARPAGTIRCRAETGEAGQRQGRDRQRRKADRRAPSAVGTGARDLGAAASERASGRATRRSPRRSMEP
jgi:multidrug efflux pump subunit AcrA (membrane-fusion protein)